MKRIIGAVAAGVVAFSGIYALAASLSVTSNSLGAGTTTVASCQAAALNVAYTPLTYTAGTGYTTAQVTMSNLQSSCYNLAYKITLYGAGGASLGEATGTTPGSGTSFTTTNLTPSPVNANLVLGVGLVIGG